MIGERPLHELLDQRRLKWCNARGVLSRSKLLMTPFLRRHTPDLRLADYYDRGGPQTTNRVKRARHKQLTQRSIEWKY